MKPPLVSIISPTYNHRAFISGAMQSVQAQSFENWEHVIVDDGSTDDTWDIVRTTALGDSRVKAFRRPHVGVWGLADTYNFALEQSRGSVVAILEGDDLWPADKLAVQIAHHSSPSTVLSYGWCEALFPDGSGRRLPGPRTSGTKAGSQFLSELLTSRAAVQPVTLMISTEALRRTGGFAQEELFAVDLPTLIRLATLPGDVVHIEHVLGFWRQHGTQVTRQVFMPGSGGSMQEVAQRIEASLRIQLRALERYPRIELSRREVISANSQGVADAYLATLRGALEEAGVWSSGDITAACRRMWRFGDGKRRIQSLFAQVCAWTGLDFELPFRLAARFASIPGPHG